MLRVRGSALVCRIQPWFVQKKCQVKENDKTVLYEVFKCSNKLLGLFKNEFKWLYHMFTILR